MSSVCYRHIDKLMRHSLIILIYIFYIRICYFGHFLIFALEVFKSGIKSNVCSLFAIEFIILFFCFERQLSGKDFQKFQFGIFKSAAVENGITSVPYHVYNIHAYALAHECVTTFSVNNSTLFVHNIVILEQTFTNTEIVLLYFFLCILYCSGYHRVFYHISLFEIHEFAIHDLSYTLRAE